MPIQLTVLFTHLCSGGGDAALSGNMAADLASKDWKVRNAAHIELKKQFEQAPGTGIV